MSDEEHATELQWAEARRWFAIAERDMRTARHCLVATPPLLESAAFSCQQAGEKLLKGLLVAGAKSFPKTHDLKDLGNRVLALHPHLRGSIEAVRSMSIWGFAYRYPYEETAIAAPEAAEIKAALACLKAFCSEIRLIEARTQ
jgi:HEPN domain-containing protein